MKDFLKEITIRKNYIFKQIVNEADSYLLQSGWIKSFKEKEPLDKDGQPIPWFTLPFFHFLETRLDTTLNIFEYGSGNSTRYLAPQVASVTSVEHDEVWYHKIINSLATNANVVLKKEAAYATAIQETDKKYDIVIIDGINRVACCEACIDNLSERGVVILDDSERAEYDSGKAFLVKKGYRELPFWGLTSGFTFISCTSLFYKDRNCLGV